MIIDVETSTSKKLFVPFVLYLIVSAVRRTKNHSTDSRPRYLTGLLFLARALGRASEALPQFLKLQ